jgi:hypothetical protein
VVDADVFAAEESAIPQGGDWHYSHTLGVWVRTMRAEPEHGAHEGRARCDGDPWVWPR